MAFILGIVALSTVYDIKKSNNKSKNSRDLLKWLLLIYFKFYVDEWLVAFSLYKNIQSLLSSDDGVSDIQTVHGVRMFNAMVLMGTYVILMMIKQVLTFTGIL